MAASSKMFSEKMSDEFCSAFRKVIANPDGKAVNTVFKDGMDLLRKQKLVQRVPMKAKSLLTHPENRGRLMLSPFNCHRNAATIFSVGGDLKQLSNATAFQMPPSGPRRLEVLQANQSLIERSKGYLAPINGEERALSVGCGHTAAFFKVAEVGGKTPEKSLQDDKGFVDAGKLKTDPALATMIEEGWMWDLIDWEVDEAFPEWAKVCQAALNTRNHVSSESSELETACVLADYIEDPTIEESMALQSVVQLCVPCSRYVKAI